MDKELQSILSSWQYKLPKVKLASLGMYTVRENDYVQDSIVPQKMETNSGKADYHGQKHMVIKSP